MPEGPLGAPRPFAVENESVIIRLNTEEDIHEATISAANGHVIQGDLKPFFTIDSVNPMSIPAPNSNEKKEIIDIEVSSDDSYISMKDAILLMNNLNDSINDTLFPSDVEIIPNIKVNRALVEPSHAPKLIIKFSSSRGTKDEFQKSMEEVTSQTPELLHVERFEQSGGENIALVVSDGIGLKDAMDAADKITGPKNKRTTDVGFDAKGIDMEEE